MTEKMDLPADLANGIVSILMKNIEPDTSRTTMPIVSTGPKPRIVKLIIVRQGQEPFLVAGFGRIATHYVIKVDIGGVAGVIAPLTGKQPPDRQLWIYGREVPMVVKFDGPLCEDGPSGWIVPSSPTWAPEPTSQGKSR